MAIVYRSEKGEPLTNAEIDGNFAHLDDRKLEKNVLSENSAMILRDSAGELTHIAIPVSRLVGRLGSGEVKALTAAEVKALLAIAMSDVIGLVAALDDKASNDVATTDDDGLMSSADKSKLDGIASGATANDTDSNLKNRANHTGEQAITTVTGLQSALDGKQNAITADGGWGAFIGTSSKSGYDVSSVTLPELAAHVKAIVDALRSAGIIADV